MLPPNSRMSHMTSVDILLISMVHHNHQPHRGSLSREEIICSGSWARWMGTGLVEMVSVYAGTVSLLWDKETEESLGSQPWEWSSRERSVP